MQHYFGSDHHPDQTQLGSTKPNIIFLHLFLFRKDRHWSWVERHHDANYEILVRSSQIMDVLFAFGKKAQAMI